MDRYIDRLNEAAAAGDAAEAARIRPDDVQDDADDAPTRL
jgi:hypothetical protein